MIQFGLAFDDRLDAERAAFALRREGYDVYIGESGSSWVLSAVAQTMRIDIESTRRRMDDLAQRFGGDFLGHGGLAYVPLTRQRVPRAPD